MMVEMKRRKVFAGETIVFMRNAYIFLFNNSGFYRMQHNSRIFFGLKHSKDFESFGLN